jgi:hypothetical protein
MNRFGTFAVAAALACFTAACAQTDAGVTTKVKAQLAADDMVKASTVNVDTHEHVVTLSGDVQNDAVRQQAVRIARTTEGVQDVVDDLHVVGTTGALDHTGVSHDGTADKRIEIKIPEEKIEIKTDDNLGDDIKDGAKATGGAIKKGANATADGAKKVGGKVRDAVTDDDKDSNKDGK